MSLDQEPIISKAGDFQLRVILMRADEQEYIVVIKNDFLSKDSAKSISESESRFHAIVSNMPGLVLQFQQNNNSDISFVYLSEGSKTLLGLNTEDLMQSPQLFYQMMNARDRSPVRTSLK